MADVVELGLPSGIDCNGCGDELYVGVRHECPVLGVIVIVESLGYRAHLPDPDA